MKTTSVKRRGFLGFLGGAVVSGPTIAKSIADTTLADAGYASAGLNPAPCSPTVPTTGQASKVVKWIKKVGIPDWKMAQIKERVNSQRQYGIDHDIACLRSVSPGWKAVEQRRRNLDRAIRASLASIHMEGDRSSFSEKIKAKFGEYVSWYD